MGSSNVRITMFRDGDGWKWVGVDNKGGRLEESEEETFVESPFSWNITLQLKNILRFCGS